MTGPILRQSKRSNPAVFGVFLQEAGEAPDGRRYYVVQRKARLSLRAAVRVPHDRPPVLWLRKREGMIPLPSAFTNNRPKEIDFRV